MHVLLWWATGHGVTKSWTQLSDQAHTYIIAVTTSLLYSTLRSYLSQFLQFYSPNLSLKFYTSGNLDSSLLGGTSQHFNLSASAEILPFELAFLPPNLFWPTQMSFPSWRFSGSTPLPHNSLPTTRYNCIVHEKRNHVFITYESSPATSITPFWFKSNEFLMWIFLKISWESIILDRKLI